MSQPPSTDAERTAPIACSLDAGDLRAQEQRWAALVRRAGIDRAATDDGVTVTFRADEGVERELRELVAAENECCAWARWEVRAGEDRELMMRASAADDGVAVLQTMFPRGT